MAGYQELAALLMGSEDSLLPKNPYYAAGAGVLSNQPAYGSFQDPWQALAAGLGSGLIGGGLAGYGKSQVQDQLTERRSKLQELLSGGDLSALANDKELAPIALAQSLEQRDMQQKRNEELAKEKRDLENKITLKQTPDAPDPTNDKNQLNSQVVKIRKEFQSLPEIQDFVQSDIGYKSLQKAIKDPSSTSDLELIRGAIQAIEPGMAVREGEQYAVSASQSIPDQYKGALSKALTGQSALSPEVREGILRIAERRYEQYSNKFNAAVPFYQGQLKGIGADPESLTYLPKVEQPSPSSVSGEIPKDLILQELKRRGVGGF